MNPGDGEDPTSRYYMWNFTNLSHSGINTQTVEFRAPPAVNRAKDCQSWVQFCVDFTNAAIRTAGSYDALKAQSPKDSSCISKLSKFMDKGYIEGCSERNLWRRLIPDKPRSEAKGFKEKLKDWLEQSMGVRRSHARSRRSRR